MSKLKSDRHFRHINVCGVLANHGWKFLLTLNSDTLNASLALQYCLNTREPRRRFTCKDTKKALITSVLSSNAEIRKNAQDVLQKRLDYDANSDIGLFETLTEYIHTNYNTSQTDRNLHIHRQSLLYRLEKTQALTGMSLTEHEDLFILETFSRIYAAF